MNKILLLDPFAVQQGYLSLSPLFVGFYVDDYACPGSCVLDEETFPTLPSPLLLSILAEMTTQ